MGQGPAATHRLDRGDAAVLEQAEAERADGVLGWERLHGGEDQGQAVCHVFVGGTSQCWGVACRDGWELRPRVLYLWAPLPLSRALSSLICGANQGRQAPSMARSQGPRGSQQAGRWAVEVWSQRGAWGAGGRRMWGVLLRTLLALPSSNRLPSETGVLEL